MTLSLVGFVSGTASSPSTVNLTLPGGSAAGDLCVGASIADLGFSATPSGFTLVDGPTGTDTLEIRSFKKVLVAGDISSGFVTMPGDANFNGIRHAIWVWHSTGGTPTVDGHATRWASDLSSPTVCDAGTVTNAGTNDGVSVLLGCRSVGTTWSATPGGVTTDQNSPAGYHSVFAYHYSQLGTGTTSAQSASLNVALGREVAAVIAVRDAAGVTTNANAGLASGTGSAQTPTFKTSSAVPAGQAIGNGQAFPATEAGETFHILLEDGSGALVDEDYAVYTTAIAVGSGAAGNPGTKVARVSQAAAGTGTAFNATATKAVVGSAGLAAGSGTAQNPTKKESANPSLASGTGTAFSATATLFTGPINANAAPALGTGTALTVSSVAKTVNSGLAAGVGTAANPTPKLSLVAGATGTGTAQPATATATTPVGLAAGTGSAFDATGVRIVNAGLASATGSAFNATASKAVPAGVAAGSGGASNATVATSATSTAGVAAGSGNANAATTAESANATAAAGAGTAFNAAATTQGATFALAGLASGAGTANNATATSTGSQIAGNAGLASATGSAFNATVVLGLVGHAEVAAGSGTAQNSTAGLAANADRAAGVGGAGQASTGNAVNGFAGLASGTGTANDATTALTIHAEVASGSGAALTPSTSFLSPDAGLATGLGTAFDLDAHVKPRAFCASGTGTAYNASRVAQPGHVQFAEGILVRHFHSRTLARRYADEHLIRRLHELSLGRDP